MPSTIEAEVVLSDRVWSVAQVAQSIGVDGSNLRRRYIKRLVDEGHEVFRGYTSGPLTELQRNTVLEFRRLSKVVRLRGDRLMDKILEYPYKPKSLECELLGICDRYGVPDCKKQQMVNEILRVFHES